MEEVFRLIPCSIILCFIFNFGCTTLNTTYLENKPESVSTPTPKRVSIENNGQIIKETGWLIPSTKEMKAGTPVFEMMTSVDGKKFKVKRNYFTPIEKVFYTEDGFSENLTKLYGKLDLWRVTEFTLNGKTFLYLILARKVLGKSQTNDNSLHSPLVEYQVLDNDGDGKFETLMEANINSEILIPKWVTE